MPNRKERRKQAALERRSEGPSRAKLPFAERLQLNVQEAIRRSVPEGTTEEEFPFAEAVRSLGMMAAVFSIQTQVSREDFVAAMGDYYDGIMSGLGAGTDAPRAQKQNDSEGFRF